MKLIPPSREKYYLSNMYNKNLCNYHNCECMCLNAPHRLHTLCLSLNLCSTVVYFALGDAKVWRWGSEPTPGPNATLLRHLTQNIPTCWYILALPNAKICVTPDANPRRQTVEYKWHWAFMYNSDRLCQFHLRLVANSNAVFSGRWALRAGSTGRCELFFLATDEYTLVGGCHRLVLADEVKLAPRWWPTKH